MTKILGISAFYHDSAASLLIDGKIVAAAQEERFSRIKHDNSFPEKSINFVLSYANIKLDEVDYIVFFEKPFLKFERLLETYIGFAPRGFISFSRAMPVWIKEKLFQKKRLFDLLNQYNGKLKDMENIYFSDHHLSHAASAFYPSNFSESLILTADGVGEWSTTTLSIGKGNRLDVIKEINFPHSLGLLYSAFTFYLGFKVNSGEYKVMGLAPYGEPIYEKIIYDYLIDIKDDGTFHINQEYFEYATGTKMINRKFEKLFGNKARSNENDNLTKFHMDIASSIQNVAETIMLQLCSSIKNEYNLENLCMAGGVALNCVANGKILRNKIFKNIWIQPAAGDAGGSIGAALAFWHKHLDKPRLNLQLTDSMSGSLLGPEYSNDEIRKIFDNIGAKYEIYEEDKLISITAKKLSEGNAIGWFQGRMEFGPRALGARSIIADPRQEKMQQNLNLKIKFRESFRPFAPAILNEKCNEWFDIDQESPYMLFVAHLNQDKQLPPRDEDYHFKGIDKLKIKRSLIPAVTHVDYTARVQTVNNQSNKRFRKLLQNFEKLTGCPLLVNTSFNVRGEPIVNTPDDAYKCFMGTELDYLIIGNFYLNKKNQPSNLLQNYKNQFKLD
tara:strand:+ start:1633 stop:3474 length:1842 start_codon:yes stop_codon:yes gene_type:complete